MLQEASRPNEGDAYVLTEAIDGKRPRVGKRRRAGHHFRQQPAGDGAKRQSMVLVAEIEPEPVDGAAPAR